MMETINIPQQIKAARRTLGLSQRQLAEIIGETRCRICDYELNRSRITAESFLKIQSLLYPTHANNEKTTEVAHSAQAVDAGSSSSPTEAGWPPAELPECERGSPHVGGPTPTARDSESGS